MEQDDEVDEFLLSLGDVELSKMIFHSPIGEEDSLRLSLTGYGFLQKAFESFELKFEEGYVVTARDLLYLKNNCRCPYYVSIKGKFIGLFEKELATRVRLVAGNLSLLT